MPSPTTTTLTTTTVSRSWSSASRLDQALFVAGVVTFASAAGYAAYNYWHSTSKTAARISKAAAVKPKAATNKTGCGCATNKPQQHSTQQPTEFAAATAAEQLTKQPLSIQQSVTSPAATVTNLPPTIRTRLSTAHGILFDLDGTLVESAEIWYRLISGASKHFGYDEVSYDEWKSTFGQSMEKNVEMWMVGLDQRRFNEYCDEHYADHLEHLHILDGSIDLLQLVNRKYGKQHVAIVTNCPRKITEIILAHLSLNQYFSHVVCAGDSIPSTTTSPLLSTANNSSVYYALQPKPATDILVQGAHQLGVAASDCVFAGDSKYDIVSGKAAGCVTVGVGIVTGDVFVKDTREAVTLFGLV